MANWLTIGKITGVHGLTGALKVWSFAESDQTFAKGLCVTLANEGEDQGLDATIAQASPRKKGVILVFDQVTTREAAEALVGKEVRVARDLLPELEKDTWYYEDLLGLLVEDSLEGEIGRIDQVFPTGADDILVVKAKGREVLIPMNRHFVDQVDLKSGKVFTTLPQGLIEE